MGSSPNSVKELLQSMMPVGLELLQGTVVSIDPLKIQIANDSKLVITGAITVIPQHLTDFEISVDISCDSKTGTLNGETKEDGSHAHAYRCESSDESATTSEVAHKHVLDTLNISNATITIRNALKVDDKLHILSIQSGKKYYVLDRV